MFHPWVRKIPWKREWLPTPVFLPAKSHGQRSLEGYSPWGGKELDVTEATEHTHMHTLSVQLFLKKKVNIIISISLGPRISGFKK